MYIHYTGYTLNFEPRSKEAFIYTLSTESNSHPEFFDPWYFFGNSKIYPQTNKFKYILPFSLTLKDLLEWFISSTSYFTTAYNNLARRNFSVNYARVAHKAFYKYYSSSDLY